MLAESRQTVVVLMIPTDVKGVHCADTVTAVTGAGEWSRRKPPANAAGHGGHGISTMWRSFEPYPQVHGPARFPLPTGATLTDLRLDGA